MQAVVVVEVVVRVVLLDVVVVVVVRVVKLVVVVVGAEMGSTICVVAQVTRPPMPVEHDAVAIEVEAGNVEPPAIKLPGQVRTPPSPVVQDVTVKVVCTVVTVKTVVEGDDPAPPSPGKPGKPGNVKLTPPVASAPIPAPRVAVPLRPIPPGPVETPRPADSPRDSERLRPKSTPAPRRVLLETPTPTPPLAPMNPSPVAVAMMQRLSGSPPLAQIEGLLVVMLPTALVSTDAESEALTEGVPEGKGLVRPPGMLVSIESEVVGTLAGIAGLVVVLSAVRSVLTGTLESRLMLGVGVLPGRLILFVSMLNDRDPASVDGKAG